MYGMIKDIKNAKKVISDIMTQIYVINEIMEMDEEELALFGKVLATGVFNKSMPALT
jgi:hypothetical protein